jgi:hypothetical protein
VRQRPTRRDQVPIERGYVEQLGFKTVELASARGSETVHSQLGLALMLDVMDFDHFAAATVGPGPGHTGSIG